MLRTNSHIIRLLRKQLSSKNSSVLSNEHTSTKLVQTPYFFNLVYFANKYITRNILRLMRYKSGKKQCYFTKPFIVTVCLRWQIFLKKDIWTFVKNH